MQKNLKIIQALVEQPAALESVISADENANKMSLADTLITLTRSSSVDAVADSETQRKVRRLRRKN